MTVEFSITTISETPYIMLGDLVTPHLQRGKICQFKQRGIMFQSRDEKLTAATTTTTRTTGTTTTTTTTKKNAKNKQRTLRALRTHTQKKKKKNNPQKKNKNYKF